MLKQREIKQRKVKPVRLLTVDTVQEARKKLKKEAEGKQPEIERIPFDQSLGRVLAEDLISPEPVPGFRRSTVDGYAVIAQNTQGVTESVPVFLEVTETVAIGHPATGTVRPGQCVYVPTGGMIPDGADAVVMVEYCESFDAHSIAVYDSVSPGRNVIAVGEDIRTEQVILKRGTRIRPQEIGVMASVGITETAVYRPWSVAIISTGDELVSADVTPGAAEIRDINTYGLEGLCEKYGFTVVEKHVLKDREELLRQTVAAAMERCDMVVVSGGSSQGEKDHTAKVLDELGEPGVFTHGIALKPGKPTILGYDQKSETVLIGLPGHPVAAMIVFQLMAVWLYHQLTGQPAEYQLTARIDTNVASAPGKETCQLVELELHEKGYTAHPIFGKSGLMTTLTRAHGYTMIDMNKEGLKPGEQILVTLF